MQRKVLLRYKVHKKIPLVLHNGSTYDYHFIIKQLAEDFKGQFECLGEITEKYMTFSVSIKEYDNNKKITYKLKFIDIYRFMRSKLSDVVDNLPDINKKECSECKGKREFIGFKNDRLHYRCKKCKKRCTKSKDRLIKKFLCIYIFAMVILLHYCWQMCLKTLEISVLKYMDLILLIFCLHQD